MSWARTSPTLMNPINVSGMSWRGALSRIFGRGQGVRNVHNDVYYLACCVVHYVVRSVCTGPGDHGVMDIDITNLDHDQISEEVRIRAAARLERLMSRMEVFLDDDPRDFSPGQLAIYLNALKLQGSLYQAFQRPVDKSGMLPAPVVEKMLEQARTEAALEAVEAEKARIALESRLALESAGAGVREALERERDRQSRAV